MVVLLLLIIGVAIATLLVLNEKDLTIISLASLAMVISSIFIGAEAANPPHVTSKKGFNVYPEYKVVGSDTVETIWHCRKKK